MNYEERQQAICKECIEGAKCPYKSRNLEHKCSNLSDIMYGWELGYKDAIKDACELLSRMVWEVTYEDLEGNSTQHYDKIEFIEEFKKAMEEQ